jgi:hypothetical protein
MSTGSEGRQDTRTGWQNGKRWLTGYKLLKQSVSLGHHALLRGVKYPYKRRDAVEATMSNPSVFCIAVLLV